MANHPKNASPVGEEEFLLMILDIEADGDPCSLAYARMLREVGVPFIRHLAKEWERAGRNASKLADVGVAVTSFCSFAITSATFPLLPENREGYAALILNGVRENLAKNPELRRKARN